MPNGSCIVHSCGPAQATQNPYPIRSPASPYAFENVRSTTTFGNRRTSARPVDAVLRGDELDVGLVEQHHGVRRAPAAGTARRRRPIPACRSGCAAGTARPPWRRAAASAMASRSWWPCASSGTVTGSSRAICAKIGYPSNVGDVITIRSPGLGHRMQHLHHHPGRAGADHHLLVAHPDVPGDQASATARGRNSGYRLAASIDSISAERTAGSGGNGFSLSDNANGSIALGSASTVSRQLARVAAVAISSRPPHRTAAAPAKSPACAKAAIITTSPALT